MRLSLNFNIFKIHIFSNLGDFKTELSIADQVLSIFKLVSLYV